MSVAVWCAVAPIVRLELRIRVGPQRIDRAGVQSEVVCVHKQGEGTMQTDARSRGGREPRRARRRLANSATEAIFDSINVTYSHLHGHLMASLNLANVMIVWNIQADSIHYYDTSRLSVQTKEGL